MGKRTFEFELRNSDLIAQIEIAVLHKFSKWVGVIAMISWTDQIQPHNVQKHESRKTSMESDYRRRLLLDQPNPSLIRLIESRFPGHAFCTYDAVGLLTYVSPNAAEVFGKLCKVGSSFFDALTDNGCNDDIKKNCWLETWDGQLREERCELHSLNGIPISFWLTQSPIFLDGKLLGVSMIVSTSLADVVVASPELVARAKTLSKGEISVVELVVEGKLNKRIATELGVAIRTVEARRSKAKKKLNIITNSDLIRTWLTVKRVLKS